MRALQIIRFDGREIMDIVDVPEPVPGDGQKLFLVSTAGITFADTDHRLSCEVHESWLGRGRALRHSGLTPTDGPATDRLDPQVQVRLIYTNSRSVHAARGIGTSSRKCQTTTQRILRIAVSIRRAERVSGVSPSVPPTVGFGRISCDSPCPPRTQLARDLVEPGEPRQ